MLTVFATLVAAQEQAGAPAATPAATSSPEASPAAVPLSAEEVKQVESSLTSSEPPVAAERRELSHTSATANYGDVDGGGGQILNNGYNVGDAFVAQPADLPDDNIEKCAPSPLAFPTPSAQPLPRLPLLCLHPHAALRHQPFLSLSLSVSPPHPHPSLQTPTHPHTTHTSHPSLLPLPLTRQHSRARVARRHKLGPYSDLNPAEGDLKSHMRYSVYTTNAYDPTTGMPSGTGLRRVPSHNSGFGYTDVGEAQLTTTTSKYAPQICTEWFIPPEAYKPQTPDALKKYRPHSNTDYDREHFVNNPEPAGPGNPNPNSPNTDPDGNVLAWPTSPNADLEYYWDTSHPPRAIFKVDGDQPLPSTEWAQVNHPSAQFGCGYCTCAECKKPARNLTDYLPISASPTLDSAGIPKHGIKADGIVSYDDDSDHMYPKWYTIEQTQLDLGVGQWRDGYSDWNGNLTNGEDHTAAPQDVAPDLFELPWITNPHDTCRCPRWDECNRIRWTQTQKYCSHHSRFDATPPKRGTWVWIATDCECDPAYTCKDPTLTYNMHTGEAFASPGNTCTPGKCALENSEWSFKGCYKSLDFPPDYQAGYGYGQFADPTSLTDFQKETLQSGAIAAAIGLASINPAKSSGTTTVTISASGGASGDGTLVDFCKSEPHCVPEETNDISVFLTARNLVGSTVPVPPCIVGTDNKGNQAIEVNLKWFEVNEIRILMETPGNVG